MARDRSRLVAMRDALTARGLRRHGVPAVAPGNPMMDGLAAGAPPPSLGACRRVLLLGGSRMPEALGNLLDNAFKWCRAAAAIDARVRPDGTLEIDVDDDGPGFDPTAGARVLERGVRADERVPGHGIGLAVVRDIVQAYGGQITLARSPLGGARVRLSLPGLVSR